MQAKLKVLSIGAGAIGTYIGGSLALHGHEVVFLERPETAHELRNRKIHLDIHGVEHQISDPTVVGSLDEAIMAGRYDMALFALKSFDAQAALNSFVPYKDQLPVFLCFSNGVENETLIAKLLGDDKVIPGTVTTAIGRRAAGNIVVEKMRGIALAGQHPQARQFSQVLDEAGLNCEHIHNGLNMKWSKMLTNLVANASSAILDLPPEAVFEHPGLFWLEIKMLRECLKVMRAQGIRVEDLPGTPAKSLAFAVRWLPLWLSRPLLARAVGGGRGEKMPSFHIDLHSRRGVSEVSYLNGAVVRYAEELGIPTPANQLLEQTLMALTLGHEGLDKYRHKPEALLAQF